MHNQTIILVHSLHIVFVPARVLGLHAYLRDSRCTTDASPHITNIMYSHKCRRPANLGYGAPILTNNKWDKA